MAYEFYIKVNGTKQGAFKGESAKEQHKAKLAGLGFHYEVKSPRDTSTGQASGKRSHQPVTFVKHWGASSPQFFQALVTNEVLKTVLFEFIRTDSNGEEEVFYTILLINAIVINYRQYIQQETNTSSYANHELEEISLSFQKIEVESKTGKTAASDDWFRRG